LYFCTQSSCIFCVVSFLLAFFPILSIVIMFVRCESSSSVKLSVWDSSFADDPSDPYDQKGSLHTSPQC
jgi:hypothetical protein